MSCTVCNHPQRQDIDRALIAGSATLAALSQEYGLSTSALHRHKAHLQAKVSRGKAQLQDNLRQGCFFWLSQALEMSLQTARAAQAEGNGKILLQALAQGTRLINLILKQDLPLDDLTVYRILTSPDWADQDGFLPHDPQVLAAGRQALIGKFASPCPEADPAPSSPDDLDLLQAMVSSLTQPTVNPPKTENHQPATANRHSPKWEKGGKLPGKNLPLGENNEEYHKDTLWQKIAGMFHPFQSPQLLELATQDPKLASWDLPADKPLSEYIYEQSL